VSALAELSILRSLTLSTTQEFL